MTEFDQRTTALREGAASIALKGQVNADHFVTGVEKVVIAALGDLRKSPDPEASLETQLLSGEPFTVYGGSGDWVWGQSGVDGYVGYVQSCALGQSSAKPTHVVRMPSTLVFPRPDIKAPPNGTLPLGARVNVTGTAIGHGTKQPFAMLAEGGAVIAHHLIAIADAESDYVAVAERFMHAPYLWGGRSSVGLDCSALVQLALSIAGIASGRDSDMQENGLGSAFEPSHADPTRRGDLVFWPGHVGIMANETDLLHANAGAMMVSCDPLSAVSNAIGTPRCYRRL